MTIVQLSVWILSTLIGAFVGSFLGAYLKTKGENLATHEDLDKLIKQMEATTNATKAIEARISNEVWDRQRQWEMKRDAILEGAFGNQESIAIDAFSRASHNFQRARLVVSVVCGNEVQTAFIEVEALLKRATLEVADGNIADYSATLPHINASATKVIRAIRKELGLDTPATIQ